MRVQGRFEAPPSHVQADEDSPDAPCPAPGTPGEVPAAGAALGWGLVTSGLGLGVQRYGGGGGPDGLASAYVDLHDRLSFLTLRLAVLTTG